jgi:hypothetical protein
MSTIADTPTRVFAPLAHGTPFPELPGFITGEPRKVFEDVRALEAAAREAATRSYDLRAEIEHAKRRDAEAAGAAIVAGTERPESEEEKLLEDLRLAEREAAAFNAAVVQRQGDLFRLLRDEAKKLTRRADAEIEKQLAAASKKTDALGAELASLAEAKDARLYLEQVVVGDLRVGQARPIGTSILLRNGEPVTVGEALDAISAALREAAEREEAAA